MRNILTKDISGILFLVAIMIVAGLMLSSQSGNGDRSVGVEETPDPSIYNDRASGSRAFFEWTAKLGRHTDVLRSPWKDLPADASMLVSIGPQVSSGKIVPMIGGEAPTADKSVLTAADASGLLPWLTSGRTLLLLTSSLPGPGSAAATTADPTSQFGKQLGLDISSSVVGMPEYLAPSVPISLLKGVGAIRTHPGSRALRDGDDGVALFGLPPSVSGRGPLKGQPFAIVFPVGKGRVVAIADTEFACNANLARMDNAVFLSNIIETYTRQGDSVLFDEFHHGDVLDSGAGVWQAMGHPLQLASIQAVLALVVLLIVLALRFGSPVPVNAQSRRSSGEYVTSLAGLYRNARAAVPALEIIYRQFLRDLCWRLALPPDVSLEQLAEAASRRANLSKSNLRRLLGNCEKALDQQSLTESELLDLVRQMERFRKELGID
jgi:hypothetical protein